MRAPPKKQNSMQKIMAKMKEIKLRVTGRMGKGVNAGQKGRVLRPSSGWGHRQGDLLHLALSTPDTLFEI